MKSVLYYSAAILLLTATPAPSTQSAAMAPEQTPQSLSGNEYHAGPNPHARLGADQHIAVANKHMQQGRIEEAVDVLARAVSANPHDTKLANALGGLLKQQCVEQKNGRFCLVLASGYFRGESKFGIQSREIVEAYKYTKLACEYGAEAGCDASKAAIEKGELLQNVLFEPDIENRGEQLQVAIRLGADMNATTLFTATLLQKAISEENIEVVWLLLENGADINYRVSDEDLTPLMYAVNTGNKDLATLLLNNGADPAQTMKAAAYLRMDKELVTACDLAEKLNNQEMTALLKCGDMTAAAN